MAKRKPSSIASAKITAAPTDEATLTLSDAQRETLAAAKAWWQEGERALDFLGERARHEGTLGRIQTLLARLRADQSAEVVASLLPLLRSLSANRALNRHLATADFARALNSLLFDAEPLPRRLETFLQTQRSVGAQTASQVLYAAFPDHYPLVSPATRAVLAPTAEQRRQARAAVHRQYHATEAAAITDTETLSLLANFALYEAARVFLNAETFVDVNAVLWHAREMPPPARRGRSTGRRKSPAGQTTVLRESGESYGVTPVDTADEARDATESDLLTYIEGSIATEGFTFPPLAVRDYYIALKTKPFVILSGLSGTGKTRLTEMLADALTGNAAPEQYLLLPVRPDWTDSAALLGYYNLIADRYVSTPFLDLLTVAALSENQGRAFFVCLDEMNLARVEHYFADILSAMETRSRAIPLPAGRTIHLPGNLFITGSVNIDEATHPFSRKVLDRANTIEFTDVRLTGNAAWPGGEKMMLPHITPQERQRLFLSSRITRAAAARERLNALCPQFPVRALSVLSALNDLLAPRGMHFGYRVRDEALCYLANSFDAVSGAGLLSADPNANLAAALDFQIVQKALPRLSGTEEMLGGLLAELERWADAEGFPRTRAKLAKMRRRAAEDGMVSFYDL